MLLAKLGPKTFWAAVKMYVATYSNRSKAEFTGDVKICGNSFCQISLEKTQGDKQNGIPAVFEITVDVSVVDVDGNSVQTQVSFTDATGPRVVAFVPLGSAKADYAIDRNGDVLFTLDFNWGGNILEAAAAKSKDIVTRVISHFVRQVQLMSAFQNWSKKGTLLSLTKVSTALESEPFPRVRAQAYAALATSSHQKSTEILAASHHTEQSPRGLRALTRACAKIKDARIRADLKNLLSHRTELTTPRILQSVYEGLGYQRHADDVDFAVTALQSASTSTDLHAYVALSVIEGIPSAVRHRGVAERITELVRADPDARIREAVIRALVAMGEDGVAHHALCEGVASTAFAAQGTRKIVALVRGMKGGARQGNQVAELKKTVEELETRLKKTEALVQSLEAKLGKSEEKP
ncbi:hypothetical protein HDU83_009757 [Entophlyctis luteolus]|nr:hypothetical protein HDU83_009757 [Entophlyctis luteolus]